MKPPRRVRLYTLLLLDDEGRVRRVRISSRAIQFAALVLGAIAVGGLAMLFVFVNDRFAIRRLEILQKRSPTAAAPESVPAERFAATPAMSGAETSGEAPSGAPIGPELLAQAQMARATMLAPERYFAAPLPRGLSRPERWPLRGWTTSEFGRRADPLSGEPDLHLGLDIAAPIGSDVRAPAAGEVLFAGERPGYGLLVALETGGGYVAYFAHLDRVVVTPGQEVQAGETLGRSGNTGQTSGPHLHYEIRRYGAPVDPRGFLPDLGQAPAEKPAGAGAARGSGPSPRADQ
jgi:murein DD-endopeptidase MepM/ murein hydrolase activator NlpD